MLMSMKSFIVECCEVLRSRNSEYSTFSMFFSSYDHYVFFPVYSPDMPKRLPIKDIVSGLLASVGKAVRYWFHYTLVTFAWLGVVPLTACKCKCAKL